MSEVPLYSGSLSFFAKMGEYSVSQGRAVADPQIKSDPTCRATKRKHPRLDPPPKKHLGHSHSVRETGDGAVEVGAVRENVERLLLGSGRHLTSASAHQEHGPQRAAAPHTRCTPPRLAHAPLATPPDASWHTRCSPRLLPASQASRPWPENKVAGCGGCWNLFLIREEEGHGLVEVRLAAEVVEADGEPHAASPREWLDLYRPPLSTQPELLLRGEARTRG